MYEAHWQLEARPFENTADERFYYPCESHQGALLKLRYAIESGRGVAVLAGASGLGKTLLTHALLRQLDGEWAPRVHLVFPQMPPDELLAYVADELTGAASATSSVKASVQRIAAAVASNSARRAVLVIDEAHLLVETGALETIRLLLNFEREGRPGLALLLVGQTMLLPALERFPELDERVAVKCLLRAFREEETFEYVGHRMTAAGCPRPVFEREAVAALHELTGGVPRRINRLADLALLVGFAEQLRTIGAAQVESVAEELLAAAAD